MMHVTYAIPQSITNSYLCCRLVSFKMSDNPLKLRKKTNWALCCFCQSQTSEKLKHPHEKAYYHQAYNSIEQDFTNFLDNNVTLPYGMTRECLIADGEACISKSLLNNKAVYHKTCRDNIQTHIIERKLQKRARDEMVEPSCSKFSPKKTRTSFDAKCNRKRPQCGQKFFVPLKNLNMRALTQHNRRALNTRKALYLSSKGFSANMAVFWSLWTREPSSVLMEKQAIIW